MADSHFLKLSEKVTINLDKVIFVQWADRDGFGSLRARITYETGKTVYYAGAEAQTLKDSLNVDSGGNKTNDKS